MNEIEIDKLEAGRELDAMIADRVMGFSFNSYGHSFTGHGHPGWHALDKLPAFSNNIAAAWQVVEKMRLSPWRWFEMAHRPSGYMCNMTGNVQHSIYAPTAPLAICKAAPKALEKPGMNEGNKEN